MVRIWDPFVRVFHWTVVVAFFIAYTTEDDLLTPHVWAGYALGGLLVLRTVWGLLGPKHARFSDFIYAPGTVNEYLRALVRFRARRYLGHSPAGGAMVLALMLGLAATIWTGLEFYADSEGKGPLASQGLAFAATATAAPVGQAPRIQLASGDENGEEEHGDHENERESVWEELHEALAHLTFVLVILHVAGVALASLAHRENLVRAMVTGLKKAEE